MITGVLPGHSSPVKCVALSRDNSYVISGGMNSTIIVHLTKTGIVEFRADSGFANGVSGLCCLPNGSGLVACGQGGQSGNLKVFSPSFELVQTLVGHDGDVYCVTVSPSGSHFASGGDDGKVMVWSEPGEGGEWARVQVLEDHTSTIWAVCFSPDGKQLATGSSAGSYDQPLQLQRGKCHLSAHVGGPHRLGQVPLVLSRLQTPLLGKLR